MDGRTARGNQRRAKTRRTLIDAAVAICAGEGHLAVTTTRLARAAGISQPGFYKHFRNVDACLEAMADEIGTAIHERDGQARRAMRMGKDPRNNIREVYRVALDAMLHDATWARLYFRYRRETGHALGRAMRDQDVRAHAQLARDIEELAQQLNVGPVPEVYLLPYVVLLRGQTDGAAQALLDGRVKDRALMIELLTELTWSFLQRFIEAKQPQE